METVPSLAKQTPDALTRPVNVRFISDLGEKENP